MDPSNLKIRSLLATDDGTQMMADLALLMIQASKQKGRYEIWKNHNGTNKTQLQRMIGGKKMRDGF